MDRKRSMWSIPVSDEQLEKLIKYRLRWSDLFVSALFLYVLSTVLAIFFGGFYEDKAPQSLRHLMTPNGVMICMWLPPFAALRAYQFVAFKKHPHRKRIEEALSNYLGAQRLYSEWKHKEKAKCLHQALAKLEKAKSCFGATSAFQTMHLEVSGGMKEQRE